MFITRASRHDRAEISEFLEANGWGGGNVAKGVTFFARDGAIVGCVRLTEVEPQTVVVGDMVVAEGRRGEGIGGSLMRAAMNSRGGTLYLACHQEHLGFYGQFGFAEATESALPRSVIDYLEKSGDYPPEGPDPHLYLKAR